MSIQGFADHKVLYLTTVGRRTGLRRSKSGLWSTASAFLFAETGEAAVWIKNIRRHAEVVVRIGQQRIAATARVLNRETERDLATGRRDCRSQIWMGRRAAGGNHPDAARPQCADKLSRRALSWKA
jgi:deazaflavin-dependent oxidoreductase (nitroreductase family)